MGRVTHYDTVQMMAYLLSQRENVAKYYVTVAAGQTHTIHWLGVSAATVVDWGDGLSNEYTGFALRAHVYASAGTYCVKIYTPENVTYFDLRDGAAVSVLNSSDLKTMANIRNFYANSLHGVTINSVDWADLRPANVQIHNLQNASITINSVDWANWRAGTFIISGSASASGTIDSADWAGWRPVIFYLNNLPGTTIEISPSSIKNWSTAATIEMRIGNLTQPQVNLILWEIYQITRTRTGGGINLSGTGNAAPSGTFQPCQSPSVSSSTPGKEIAYELLNDSLGVGFNKWATVNTN